MSHVQRKIEEKKRGRNYRGFAQIRSGRKEDFLGLFGMW